MSLLRSSSKTGQSGFTLIELLIVVAIMGILAGVTIPNVSAFVKDGSLKAASTELENVKTASVGYLGSYGEWPANSVELDDLLSGTPKAIYQFDGDTGFVVSVSDVTWSGITWSAPSSPYTEHGKWTK